MWMLKGHFKMVRSGELNERRLANFFLSLSPVTQCSLFSLPIIKFVCTSLPVPCRGLCVVAQAHWGTDKQTFKLIHLKTRKIMHTLLMRGDIALPCNTNDANLFRKKWKEKFDHIHWWLHLLPNKKELNRFAFSTFFSNDIPRKERKNYK